MRIFATSSATGFGPTVALSVFLNWAASRRLASVDVSIPAEAAGLLGGRVPSSWHLATRSGSDAYGATPLAQCDLLVNFGRTELVVGERFWRRQVFVDCVGWLNVNNLSRVVRWPDLDTMPLVEWFPLVERNEVPSNVTLIRACIPPKGRRSVVDRHLLVTLGGGIFPQLNHEHGPMLSIANELSACFDDQLPLKPVLYAGSATRHGATPIRLHRAMLRHACVVLTVPGLYTIFEAVQERKPLVVLPPSNYTQALQYLWYLNAGVLPPITDWRDIVDLQAIPFPPISLNEEARVSAALWYNLRRAGVARKVAERAAVAAIAALADSSGAAVTCWRDALAEYTDADYPTLESVLNEVI